MPYNPMLDAVPVYQPGIRLHSDLKGLLITVNVAVMVELLGSKMQGPGRPCISRVFQEMACSAFIPSANAYEGARVI